MAEHKFPSEVIDLPSEGKLYPKEHPCSNGKIEIKYMTAKEEDILTSQNLIKKPEQERFWFGWFRRATEV